MKRTQSYRIAATLLLLLGTALQAEDSPRNKPLDDPLLDKLIGDWKVERKLGNGRSEKNIVHVEWVLQHHFVQLHYRDAAIPPQYEALVLIGYDDFAQRYLCHWADIFGGAFSTDGFATRAEGSNALEFKFEVPRWEANESLCVRFSLRHMDFYYSTSGKGRMEAILRRQTHPVSGLYRSDRALWSNVTIVVCLPDRDEPCTNG